MREPLEDRIAALREVYVDKLLSPKECQKRLGLTLDQYKYVLKKANLVEERKARARALDKGFLVFEAGGVQREVLRSQGLRRSLKKAKERLREGGGRKAFQSLYDQDPSLVTVRMVYAHDPEYHKINNELIQKKARNTAANNVAFKERIEAGEFDTPRPLRREQETSSYAPPDREFQPDYPDNFKDDLDPNRHSSDGQVHDAIPLLEQAQYDADSYLPIKEIQQYVYTEQGLYKLDPKSAMFERKKLELDRAINLKTQRGGADNMSRRNPDTKILEPHYVLGFFMGHCLFSGIRDRAHKQKYWVDPKTNRRAPLEETFTPGNETRRAAAARLKHDREEDIRRHDFYEEGGNGYYPTIGKKNLEFNTREEYVESRKDYYNHDPLANWRFMSYSATGVWPLSGLSEEDTEKYRDYHPPKPKRPYQ